jgi:hypothetical protein
MYVQRNIEARLRIIVAVAKQYVLLTGLCVRACMWVSGRVGVCMRIRAYTLANPARNVYAPYCEVICGPSVFSIFFGTVS